MANDAAAQFLRLLEILCHLRSEEGCAWDRKQKMDDIVPYLLEEAYELADAIKGNHLRPSAVQEELGDLLFQILFIAQIAREENLFTIGDVLSEIAAKMVRRHPHVFAGSSANNIEEIKSNWEMIKSEEKRGTTEGNIFQGIPKSQPALTRARRITEKAAQVGFDWDSAAEVLIKLEEEYREFQHTLAGEDGQGIKEEVGDLLFTLVNLCRHLHVDPEEALHLATDKFMTRFFYLEEQLSARGLTTAQATPALMDRLWNQAKVSKKGM